MKVADLVRAMELIAPLAFAEEWDNVGLLAGDPAAPLRRVLVTIDCTREVVDEAERAGCEAIVAYHPPLLKAVTRIAAGSVLHELVRRGIALYSPHTALDAAPGGTNDVLADAVGLVDRAPIRHFAKDADYKLVTFVPAGALAKVSDALFAAGAGRIGDYRSCSFRTAGSGTFFGEEGASPAVGRAGTLETVDEIRLETVVPIGRAADVVRALRGAHPYEEPAFDLVRLAAAPSPRGMGRIGAIAPVDRTAVVERVKARLGVEHVLVAGPRTGDATRAAVCAGATGDLLEAAIRQGAHVIVAGETRHHDALRAATAGVTVVCALHSNSERITMPPLAAKLAAALGVEARVSEVDRDPFVVA
jgi:dinuclear metal center YbgI/SA1388 family protein